VYGSAVVVRNQEVITYRGVILHILRGNEPVDDIILTE
jgi:hypothetical protein